MIFEKQVLGAFKGMAYSRCDDTGMAYYFSSDDFEGLKKVPYSFTASAGHTLQGYIYSYEAPIKDRLVVFDHGFFGGHRSYMKEIEMLCRHGYTVFAYDHTGCMESGGKDPNGMAQSLCDLNDCISTLKKDDSFKGIDISVVGHSWGGFSTLNICALHPDVSHIVAISGFVSVEKMLEQNFTGFLRLYRKHLYEVDRKTNPDYVDCDGVQALAGSRAKILLIYSDNDPLVHTAIHYEALRAGLEGKPNVTLRLVSGKGHNPNYTADAVAYKNEFLAALKESNKHAALETRGQKENFKASFDWNRMTAQDEAVWSMIFAHLDAAEEGR